MRLRALLALLPLLLFCACIDGVYDPEGVWELNCQEPDNCEENDTFNDAYETHPGDPYLIYLNFYDDRYDYFLCDFDVGSTYSITTDVPFDHQTQTVIAVFDTSYGAVTTSTPSPDDARDAVITGFAPSDPYYYLMVMNDATSGTGELRGYMLLIEEKD
jgi:hypothetical protein